MTNATLEDTLGSARAIVAFSAILLCPGYLLGRAADLFGFRTRRLRERLACGIALSFATMPIFTQLAARLIGIAGVAIVSALCACISLGLVFRARPRLLLPRDPHLRKLIAFVCFGAAVLIVELLDFQFGNRLHLGVSALDQGYRVGFTNAIARGGIPPVNPFYHPGAGAALRYYYFWYALCAVAMKLAHTTARQALIAGSVWCGLGLTAMIALFLRHFLRVRESLNRHILTATLLLTVTGADLIPVLHNLFARNDFGGETEWWSPDQIASWMDTLIWVPNHASGLIACLTVFLLLWRCGEAIPAHQKTIATLFAGVAFASSFGLSIYIAAGLVMMLAAWALRETIFTRSLSFLIRLVAVAILAGILLAPYLGDLFHSASGTEGRTASGPTHVLVFGIRRMLDPAPILAMPRLAHLAATHPLLLDRVIRIALLIPGYALELGFFAAALFFAWLDRRQLDEARRTALFLAFTGLAIVTVIRSAVIGNNDFGTRAALLPCFFLLLLATGVLLDVQDKKAHKLRAAILSPLLLLGLAGTAFQALALRFYIPIHSAHNAPGFQGLAESALDTRTAYAAAGRLIPVEAIIQSDPTGQGSYFYVANMLFATRAMASDAAVDCGAVFGGDPSLCQPTQEAIRQLFYTPAANAADAQSLCARIGIQYLTASRRDPGWPNPGGWVWNLPSIAAQSSIRIVQCGTIPQK